MEELKRMEQSRLSRRSNASKLPEAPHVITEMQQLVNPEVLRNALLLVDKPKGWEDQEVVRALHLELGRLRSKDKRLPVIANVNGLETAATGLLVTLLGSATKLTHALHDVDKVYSGIIRLGQATRTCDTTSPVLQELPWSEISDEEIASVSRAFNGELLLMPPPFTTVKVGGKRETSSRDDLLTSSKQQPVLVRSFEASRMEPGSRDVKFRVTLYQSGFVRSLAADFGLRLGTCSHLLKLQRDAVGPFNLDNAWSFAELQSFLRSRTRG
jgi:tRNA pseudouridine55 synthase